MTPPPRPCIPGRGTARAQVLGVLALVLLVGACRTRPTPPAAHPAAAPEAPAAPRMEPLDASLGHVLLVNAPLRFVVVDFSLSQMPQPGDLLEVTRAGEVVGQLKVGYHARANTLVADIVEGRPAVGDEARPARP